ncbi:MAG: hypothetical protein DHS20C11_06690 [Lysobacteraceae bacterium]|nr:MAG: hypothetical protein DHS20C11_06690 [Xanthomonadaceae bacterium]
MNNERWLTLMSEWGFGPNLDTFESLRTAYSEKGRHYHTAQHITACLRHMDRCAKTLEHPREVELALWFHDAVYKPLSSCNERKSADWAAAFLTLNGASESEVSRVHRLIMATEHDAPTQTNDESALVDIDLSILGTNAETYEAFESAVRKEYRLIPWMLYRRKRAEVLRGFLERQKIYQSGFFSADVERQAKENLSNAVRKLEGRLR